MRHRLLLPATILALASLATTSALPQSTILPPALTAMADSERAFAQRATVIGWKKAFLEYFADDSLGFDGDKTASLKAQISQVPDPPAGVQLLWEPRYGDIAASGELGWLTGPSTSINPARNNGAPRYSTYTSVWKRQPDGSFKVFIDVGTNQPVASPFAPGFVRLPLASHYTGTDTVDAARTSLRAADTRANAAMRGNGGRDLAPVLSPGARFHRNEVVPVTGDRAIAEWVAQQPAWSAAQTAQAEVAQSRDLGYSYGTYAAGTQKGWYVRTWARDGAGNWKIALDVLQPQ